MQVAVCSQVAQMFVTRAALITFESLLIIQLDAHVVVIVVDNRC
jgi:hypothetical protein